MALSRQKPHEEENGARKEYEKKRKNNKSTRKYHPSDTQLEFLLIERNKKSAKKNTTHCYDCVCSHIIAKEPENIVVKAAAATTRITPAITTNNNTL